MRRLLSVISGVLIVVAALAGMGSAAGAVDGATCSFSVAAAASAGHIDITGTGPANVYVKAFVGGNINPAGTTQANGSGNFAILGIAGATSDTITVSYSTDPDTAYPTTSCIRVGEEIVVRPGGAIGVSAAEATLAFTGSSGTSLVPVGLAAAVVGLALVVAVRRRGAHAR
jgi:hypothetical protein